MSYGKETYNKKATGVIGTLMNCSGLKRDMRLKGHGSYTKW